MLFRQSRAIFTWNCFPDKKRKQSSWLSHCLGRKITTMAKKLMLSLYLGLFCIQTIMYFRQQLWKSDWSCCVRTMPHSLEFRSLWEVSDSCEDRKSKCSNRDSERTFLVFEKTLKSKTIAKWKKMLTKDIKDKSISKLRKSWLQLKYLEN